MINKLESVLEGGVGRTKSRVRKIRIPRVVGSRESCNFKYGVQARPHCAGDS